MVDSILWQALMHRCKCLRKPPAAGFALMKMMGSAGSFVGPYFIGVSSDASGSFTPAMLLLALCLLCAGVMQLFFREPGKMISFESLCSPQLVDWLFKPANHPLAYPVLISLYIRKAACSWRRTAYWTLTGRGVCCRREQGVAAAMAI